MGIAIANAFAHEGADVTLVLGPTHLSPTRAVKCIRIESSNEMYEHCVELFKKSNTDKKEKGDDDEKQTEKKEMNSVDKKEVAIALEALEKLKAEKELEQKS